jgi:hypothetical protein
MGVTFALLMMAMDVIGRTGAFEGIPILGWDTTVGPFTMQWMTVILIKRSIMGVIFGLLWRRFRSPRDANPSTNGSP